MSLSKVDELVQRVAGVHLLTRNALPRHRWVVAIDFGTAYSGYAFFMTSGDGIIEVNTKWGYESANRYKTATAVLLDADREFKSFGEVAQKEFLEMEPEDADECYFFLKFKMLLHEKWENTGKRLTRREMLAASNNRRELPAIDVIAHALRFMKDNFHENVERSVGHEVQYNDVIWVITVPAIWNDAAKQFMREAAVEAGLVRADDPNRLLMALEPEAAGLWCKELQTEGFVGQPSASDIRHPEPGDSYMIIDAGGGTIDIAVHEIQPDGSVKETYAPSGGPWGGDYVNQHFERALGEMFQDCIAQYRREDSPGYFDFIQSFENAKRTWDYKNDKPLRIQFPSQLLTLINESGEDMRDLLQQWCDDVGYEVTFKRGYLLVSHECAKMFFEQVVEETVDHVVELLQKPGVKNVRTVFMVGGFSECNYLQDRLKDGLGSGYRTLVPNDAGLSVLKGAVMFGRNPQAVQERVAKLTYGIIVAEKFNRRVHDPNRRVMLHGEEYCEDVFAPYIKAGQVVRVGKVVFDQNLHMFAPVNEEATEFQADIYASPFPDVRYKDEQGKQTKKVGTVRVQLDPHQQHDSDERPCAVSFACGSTEVQVVAVDIATGTASNKVKIDFLEDASG